MQQSPDSDFITKPSKQKATPMVETIKEDSDAGWPSFGQLIIDLSRIGLEALMTVLLYIIPFRFRPERSKPGLVPLKDSLVMSEDEPEHTVVQKQRTPTPVSETRQAHTPNLIKPPKIKSASFKDPSLSSKHRSSKRQEYAEFYGSGEVSNYSQTRSKSQKERTKHRQRDKSGDAVFRTGGTEPKPVEMNAVDYDDPKFARYNLRNKYESGDSFRF